MQSEPKYWPSAAEFPHDNPEFDRFALWDSSALRFFDPPSVTAPPTSTLPATSTSTLPASSGSSASAAGTLDDAALAAIDAQTATSSATLPETDGLVSGRSSPADGGTASPVVETTPPAGGEGGPPATPMGTIEPEGVAAAEDDPINAFVRAVTEVALAYGPAETAAQIESLFHFGTFDSESLTPDARAALCDGKILETTEDLRPTEAFASTRSAWQSILRGESGDLSACGDSTLDAWTADLVARLVAHPDKAPTIRRDLRRRGIAAFGMLG